MNNKREAGIIKLIIIIVIAVLVLSYFGINIKKIAESDTGQANFGYLWSIIQQIWDWLVNLYQKYLASYINVGKSYLPNYLVK